MAASDDDNAILRELARSEYHLASSARPEALPSVCVRHQRLLRRASAACIEGQYHSGQRGNWNRTKPTLLPDTVAAAILAIAVDPPTMADRSEAMLELAWAHHVPSGALGHLS